MALPIGRGCSPVAKYSAIRLVWRERGLLAREKTGKGQKIEIEMLAGALSLQTSRIAEYFATGEQPQPMGSATTTTVPHQAFLCEDQKYIAVGVVQEDQWPRFCRALKLEELAGVSEVRRSGHFVRLAGGDAALQSP